MFLLLIQIIKKEKNLSYGKSLLQMQLRLSLVHFDLLVYLLPLGQK